MTAEEYTEKLKEHEGEPCSKCFGTLVYDENDDILRCDHCGWEYFIWEDTGNLGSI